MSHPATARAAPRIALRGEVASARLRFAAGVQALILVLLARLFARDAAAWHISLDALDAGHPAQYNAVMPMGRAPHAAVVEAGLVPDWVLSGMRNRAMRPAAIPARPRPRARLARAPPAATAPSR